ncbi:MAG: hypothetical protein ABIB79_01140 [archaeon]
MGDLIIFDLHPIRKKIEELAYLESQCDLLLKDINYAESDSYLPYCYGYSGECFSCEVPKNNHDVRKRLTKLIFLGEGQ